MSADARLDNLILAVANHQAVKGLGKTKLWKLIYFIESALLREEGVEPAVRFVKQPHGPVPAHGPQRLEVLSQTGAVAIKIGRSGSYEIHEVLAVSKPTAGIFTPKEVELINKVCTQYGKQQAFVLSEISHDEPAWIKARMGAELDPALMAYGRKEDPEGL